MVKSALAPDPIENPGITSHNAEVRQGLLQRLVLALRIAKRTVQYLGADGFNGATLPEGNFAAEKPLAEAAMLLYVASRERSDPAVQARFEGLVRDLIPYARSKRMGWDTLRYPSVCLQLATPHILLERIGSKDRAFDDLLARSVAACASRGHEVLPYREVELIWLRSLWRNEIPGCELEETARKTALGNPIDLLNGTREDAYAHTHAIMYYTDFGNWPRPLPRATEEFLSESAAVLARALIVEDYDLAAEALMAWPLTSSVWSPAAAFGFRVLASLEDKTGFLPSGPTPSKRLPELAGEEKTRLALASSYHTAFVMGMLCALSLRPGMASPFEMAGPAFPTTVIESLQSSITKTDAHWEQIFQSLSPNEQAVLAPFLLDVAMIQRSRRNDFAQMLKMLETAMQHGMADTTLCAQSAELLSRVGSFAASTA
jgi:hypothetical protein